MSLFRCIAALILVLASPMSKAATAPAVAAASDLKFALTEVADRFLHDTGAAVRLTFASSGNLVQQLENGAPFELFMSADEGFVFRLAEQGLTLDRGVLHAIGRLVLFTAHGSPVTADAGLKDLALAIQDGRLKRLAIANPDHAPYGRAARAVLQHAGLWEGVQPCLVFGENASQAMQFAASGPSQAGIVPLSLSRASPVASLGTFAPIPAAWHASEPLHQRMVLMKSAGDTARRFYEYLQAPPAREIFRRYGFVLPGEDAP